MSTHPYRHDSELDGDVVLTISSPSERARQWQARALRGLGGLAVALTCGWLAWGIVRALDESPELPTPHLAPAPRAATAIEAPATSSPAPDGGLQLRLSERLSPR